jgi:hypothetical protein
VSNPVGSVTSIVASLIIQTSAPAITSQPVGATIIEGSPFTLTVDATGSPPLFYQWLTDATNSIPGATNASLVFASVRTTNAATYQVRITNLLGSVLSSPAVLNVEIVPPSIIQSPADTLAAPGEDVTITASVSGSGLVYRWFFNGTNLLAGATNTALLLPNVQAGNAGTYLVVATNVFGAVTSAPATLTLTNTAPLFRTQPDSVQADVSPVASVSFSVSILGAKPLFYQWFFNDSALSVPGTNNFVFTNTASGSLFRITNGLSGSSVTVSGITTNEEGVFHLFVTNLLGSALSDDALLDVSGFGTGN